MHRIERSVLIGSPSQTVFSVVKNLENYPQFMRHVKSLHVEKRSQREFISSWHVDIEGADLTWKERNIFDEEAMKMDFSMLTGDYEAYFGQWHVLPEGSRSRLSVKFNIDWGIPSFGKILGSVLEEKTEKIINGLLRAIKWRCQRIDPVCDRKIPHFAFVIHPLDVGLVSRAFQEPSLLGKKRSLVKKAFEWLPSFRCSEVTGVRSSEGFPVKGELFYVPLLPDQMLSLDEKLVLGRILSAGRTAQKNGAKILGLGAYAAQVGRKGVAVAKALQIPVTTGTHYTIAIAIESILLAARKIGLKIEESTIAIIGASGAIGRLCAESFSERARQVILLARNRSRLETLAHSLPNASIAFDLKRAMDEADISIMATTTPVPLVDEAELKPGSLVCDVSRPRNVSRKGSHPREDLLVIDGGIVSPPGEDADFNFYFGLPKGLAYACMAETMILAMEEKYESYSLGGEVSLDKVKEITALGQKHGFRLSRIMSFGEEVKEETFDKIAAVRKEAS
ncbi:MAG: SRPBCC family protein [Candidatus Omnitrophica bacterium]|nr:SRPBCC family protein [Candidatus Omnitrophota bacterium]